MNTVHPDSYLVILNTFHKHDGRQNIIWCRVLCTACGIEKDVQKHSIFGLSTNGNVRSCGCQRTKLIAEKTCFRSSPGSSRRPEYKTWGSMIQRCYNPSCSRFGDYGARGITVCARWRDSFDAFLEDMGPRPKGHSLDRIDNSKGYQPDNCRWATITTQNNNRRSCVYITHDNRTLTLAQWAEVTGISYLALHDRHRAGKTGDDLFKPVKNHKARCQ